MKKKFFLLVIIMLTVLPTYLMANTTNDLPAAKLSAEITLVYPEMVPIPAGEFMLGQILPNGLRLGFPVHKVTLTNEFEMGKYEISNSEYCNMLNYALSKGYLTGDYQNNITVKNKEGKTRELIALSADFKGITCEIQFNGEKFIVKEGKAKRPVVYVTWHGAAFYCNILSEQASLSKLYDLNTWACTAYGKKGYRLPTEAEWEYVARYNDGRMFAWGNQYDVAKMNFDLNVGHATDIDSYPEGKNALGLYNMTGNVEEWVNDWYGTYPTEDQINPTGVKDSVYKEKRGGSWYKDDNNLPFLAYRYDTNYTYTFFFDIGFRIIKI